MRYVLLMLCLLSLAPMVAAQDTMLAQEGTVDPLPDPALMQEEAAPAENEASLEDSDRDPDEESVANQLRIPEDHWEAIQSDPDFRYSPPQEEKARRRSWSGGLSFLRILAHPAFRVLLFLLIGVALLWALRRVLAQSGLEWRGRRKRTAQADDTALPEEELAAHQLNALQAEAQARGDFRLAFRYRYLQVLRNLGEEGLIRLEADCTNWDYVRQLKGHALYIAFGSLTRSFDQIWYGQYVLTESLYQRLLQANRDFDSLQKQAQA